VAEELDFVGTLLTKTTGEKKSVREIKHTGEKLGTNKGRLKRETSAGETRIKGQGSGGKTKKKNQVSCWDGRCGKY